MKLRSFGFLIAVCVLISGLDAPAFAGTRRSSGSYQSSRGGSGTFQRTVNREGRGNVTRDTTWQNERGEGSRHLERTWDKETGTGTYSTATTRADGKTVLRSGTLTKTADNQITKQGTITGPNGNTLTVDKTITKAEDGDRTITRTLTNEDGETATHVVSRDREGDTVMRTVTNTNFNGNTNTNTRTVTLDPQT